MSNAKFSILQAKAVKDKRITDAQFRTLAALGMYADEDGWCFPKQATIGDDIDKSRQAINRDIKALRELGYIEVRPQFKDDGGRRANKYRLIYDTHETPALQGVKQSYVTGGETSKGDSITSQENAPTPEKKEGTQASKPLKANQIPQVILFREVTRRYPSKGSQFTVITSVDKIGDRLGKDATAQDLEPFYREWCDRGYNPVSVKWLSEWAVNGAIPKNGSKPTAPKGMSVAQSWLEKRQAANG